MTNDEGMTKSEGRNLHFDDSLWDDSAGLVCEEAESERVYDLEERTARFGEAVIDFAKTMPQNPVTNRIIAQLVGAGTSVGANYVEADDAVSRKEFPKSIGTCRKEARETKTERNNNEFTDLLQKITNSITPYRTGVRRAGSTRNRARRRGD